MPGGPGASVRNVSSIHCQGSMVQRRTAGGSTLKASWGTRGCAHGSTDGAHGGRITSLRKTPTKGESTNVSQQAATTALHAAVTASAATISAPNVVTTAGVTHIEHHSVHAIDELVEGCMCHILDSR